MQDEGVWAGVVFFFLQENTESNPKRLQGTASPHKTQTLQATDRTLAFHFCGTQLGETFGFLWFKNSNVHPIPSALQKWRKKVCAIFAICAITVVPDFGRKKSVVIPFPGMLLSQAFIQLGTLGITSPGVRPIA